MWFQKYNTVYMNEETGGESQGGAGGDGGDIPPITETPEFKAALQQSVESAISGLQAKNQELISKQKELKSNLAKFDGIDPEQTRKMYDAMNKSEEAKLIAEGKIDEVIQKRSDRMVAEFNDQINDLTNKLNQQTEASQTYRNQLKSKTIDDNIRGTALELNVRTEALDDVLRRAGDVFDLDNNGQIEARKDGELVLAEDGTLLTPEKYVKQLRKTHPHYFPESTGANMSTTKNRQSREQGADLQAAANKDNFDLAKYRAERAKTGNNSRYR